MSSRPWLLLILLWVAGEAVAQRFNGGVLLGGNVSQVDGDTWQGYHKFGFQAGGLVALRISPHSSFQMELEYFQKGSRQNGDSTGGNTSSSQISTYLLRLHYIEIPVLYQYTFAKRFFAEVGAAAVINVGSKELVNGFPDPDPVPLRAVTAAGILGIGGYITRHLKADFRFNYSLMSIRNGTEAAYRKILFEVGQYNNVLALTLYWDFKPNEGW
ncbi:MAG TPA: porin family protein [Bacteroidales bacterium]|nr:porin family protein [Bacteroidales bacterium]